jgi:hypothetical protein
MKQIAQSSVGQDDDFCRLPPSKRFIWSPVSPSTVSNLHTTHSERDDRRQPGGRSIDDVAVGRGSVATLLKPLDLSVLHEPVRRVVSCLAGARGLTAPLRRYTSNGRLRHPIWLGPADSPQSGQEPALASGRGARGCRGLRAMVWVCKQLGAQETSATALLNLPVVGARWAALASELTAGPAAPGLKDISRRVARSAEVWSRLAGTIVSPQVGSRSATRACSTKSDSSGCRTRGISAGLRGKCPRRPHTKKTSHFGLPGSLNGSVFIPGPEVRVVPAPSAQICSRTDHCCSLVRKWHKSCRHVLRGHAAIAYFLRDVARQRNVVARRCGCNSDSVE